MASTQDADHPEGIFSLLDTDLYKLTMQCAVLKFFPQANVSYKFTNRTPHMKLTKRAFEWLQNQVRKLANVRITDEEIAWLTKTCPFLSATYLEYLRVYFRLRPTQHVDLTFTPASEPVDDSTPGDLSIVVQGLWVDTILYEIPLLALTSEAYFKFVDRDWNHDGQMETAKAKGVKLIESGCVFSEFGSRRRRDYKTHEAVMQGLVAAVKEAEANGKDWTGKFTGTSNVHFAMRFGVNPVGTVAHEWFMGIAALSGDYGSANEKALQYWTATYGRGVLAIALTDTFGTPNFLKAFARPAPQSGTTDSIHPATDPTYAEIFTGVRQDSGDPLEFVKIMHKFYTSSNISAKKSIVFSDSLNVDKCIKYKAATEEAGLAPSFGIGTFFTNDFTQQSQNDVKSVPLNIVIKLSAAEGKPCIKLSDDKGKNMGDSQLMREVKGQVGYKDKAWSGGDETHRWDGKG